MKKLPLIILAATSLSAFGQDDAPLMLLEAESASLTAPVKVKRVDGYSGNAYVGDFDNGSEILFRHVRVDKEGTYEFRVYYTSMFMRSVNVCVNSYPAITIPMTRTTPEWDKPPVAMMLSYIWLDEGDNTISITPPATGGPNIDKFEIWQTGVEMPRPVISDPAFGYDLTDDAARISFCGEDVSDSALADNSIATVFSLGGRKGYVEYEFEQPYLVSGVLLSEGTGAEKQGRDWMVEYSVDGVNYRQLKAGETISAGNATLYRINRQPHADKALAARYFRVDSRGRDIAEIQLFGIPYLANDDRRNFPTDITEGIDLQKRANGQPTGETEWADERFYNLFDRDMQTKFYTDKSRTAWVEIELDKPMSLHSYTLTSCQDYPERDPRSWVVEGFDRSWETVSEVNGFEFPCRYASMRFQSDSDKLYRGFRLRVTENNGADRFQLLKWQLFGSENSGVENVSLPEQAVSIGTAPGALAIYSPVPASFAIYTPDGHKAAAGQTNGNSTVSLPSGLYIVAVESAAGQYVKKIIVR